MPKQNNDVVNEMDSQSASPKPLSMREKRQIVRKLKEIDSDDLLPALVAAAKNRCKFPAALESKLMPLYAASVVNQSNPKVLKHLMQAIQAYIESEGIKQYQNLLKEDFKETIWSTELLSFLSNYLDIKIKNDPTVQVAIENGKIYWRIMRDQKEIFNRHEDFDFDKVSTWFMTWEQFRLFKDAGKRNSSVAITKKRFIQQFDEKYHTQVRFVSQEMKEKGILDEKGRLTDAWRASSNTIVLLNSITDGEITTDDVQKCLEECADDNRNIDEQQFMSYWYPPFKSRAALIWKQLKKIRHITEANVVSQKILSIDKFLADINLSHAQIAEAIYKVCNNGDYCQTPHKDLPKYTIFRKERALQSWKSDGTVNNVTPKNNDYATMLWDVGIYKDLSAHRNTVQERKDNTCKLNYDHVPSADVLKQQLKRLQDNYEKRIDEIEKQIESLKLKKSKRLAELTSDQSKTFSRTKRQALSVSDNKIQELVAKMKKLKSKLEVLNLEQVTLDNENKGHGLLWWSIAIPEKLHHQGETFMQASVDQQQKQSGHFLTDLNAYLNILETRASDFSLATTDDVIKAVGAFRYLYKQNLKPAQKIDDKYTTGITPHHFFKQSGEKDGIDERFRSSIKKLLVKREGAPVDQIPQKLTRTK